MPRLPKTPPHQGKINAAEFLTKADAEAILGKPVGDRPGGRRTITSNVSYIATAGFSGINLFVRAGTGPQTLREGPGIVQDYCGRRSGVDRRPG